jgi:Mrp family chromosome partitioning ATPase
MTLVNWQRSIEQIMLSSTDSKTRVLGLTSVRRGAGLSLVCRQLARTVAAAEFKTLLVDMSKPRGGVAVDTTRSPAPTEVRTSIVPSGDGYDVLRGRAGDEWRSLFGSLPRLRETLGTDLEDYTRIVLDMPPIIDDLDTGINSIALAAICDRLLLVCAVGRDTRSELSKSVALLRGAGITLSGIVSNEQLQVDPRAEFGQLASAWRFRRPRAHSAAARD